MDYNEALDILGVDPKTPMEEVKAVYRRLILAIQPNHNQGDKSETMVRELNDAYTLLRNKFKVDELSEEGLEFTKARNYQQAIECYNKAINLASEIKLNDARFWYNMGYDFDELGHLDDAIKCYDKALEINQKDADIYNNKGCDLEKLGYFEDAIKCFNESLKINSKHRLAINNKRYTAEKLKALKFDKKASSAIKQKPGIEHYRLLLEKLEKQHEAGKVPDDIYHKLKDEYESNTNQGSQKKR